MLRTFLFVLAAIAAAPVFATPPSRLAYAQQCAAEMGAIPNIKCMDGDVIPITKNGQPVTLPTGDSNCDKPVQLGLDPGNGQCVPYARFQTISTGNPNVTTAVVCRKYGPSTGPNDPFFRDIAVIQHDRTTGNTCFFQSKLEGPLHNGTDVPSPQSSSAAASNVWYEPMPDGPNNIRCTRCHDADPFIWSPYIEQVADLSQWDPNGPWNSNFLDVFTTTVKTFEPDNNECTVCHRIGNQVCDSSGGGHVSVPEVAANHWMPPGFSGSNAAYQAKFGASLAQIKSCCTNPNQAVCKTKEAIGTPAPPSTPADITQLLEATLLPLREP